MARIDKAAKQLTVKIVYYGAVGSGRSTNMRFVRTHVRTFPGSMSKLNHLPVGDSDKVLFFEYLPAKKVKTSGGLNVKIQVHTVLGKARFQASHQAVLREADGIVFVVDSQESRMTDNAMEFRRLQDNILASGRILANLPLVVQFNKQDLSSTLPGKTISKLLALEDVPKIPAISRSGWGVMETLHKLIPMVCEKF